MANRYDYENEVIGIDKIMKYLPHRYPFLLIDRVIEYTCGNRIVTLKNVSFNDPIFQGHYPGVPIYPGAYIMEAMGQSSALLASMTWDQFESNAFLLLKVDGLKYRRVVRPGDTICFEVELLGKRNKPPFQFSAQAYVGNTLVAEGLLLCTVQA